MQVALNTAINLNSASFRLEEEGFIRIRPNDAIMVDLEEAIKQSYAIQKLCDGEKLPFLVDNRGVFPLYTPEARDYLFHSEEIKSYRLAEAILLTQLPTMAKEGMEQQDSACPNQYFLYESEAINWLRTFT